MKKRVLLLVFISALCLAIKSQTFPQEIYSGLQETMHVQGIAYDADNECMYMSFTTSLIKTDMQGRLLGSVKGLTGHLGSITWNPQDGRVYGSLEYKHDVIGQGILNATGVKNDDATGYYIAIFDCDKITRENMSPDEVMTTVYLPEVLKDVEAKVTNQGKTLDHRFGTAGVDGVTFAPKIGSKGGKLYLYVAYGFFPDITRTDNDHQILLCYDVSGWKKYERRIDPTHIHQSGPKKPCGKYFVRTGHTTWGIQNLAYDTSTGHIFATVYKGKKSDWPNYSLFLIDTASKAKSALLEGVEPATKAPMLDLVKSGLHDEGRDVWGWNFPYGSTGIVSLGSGLFYISHNGRDKATNREYTRLRLYRWSDSSGMTIVE